MTLDEIVRRFDAKRSGTEYMARCPAHDDDTASLAIKQDHDKILLHCFSHCQTEAILRAKNLTMKDLFVSRNGHQSAIVATYLYRDLTGKVRYRKQRTADKRFWLERPDGRGGWIKNMRGVERLLYRLDELRKRSAAFDTTEFRIYLVEGEKDCERLWSHGLPATTNDDGASEDGRKPKWKRHLTQQLTTIGATEVICLPDHDAAGRAHMQAAAKSCHAAGLAVRLVDLPDLPPKGDVSDWLNAGHLIHELIALTDAADVYTPPSLDEEEKESSADARDFVKKNGVIVANSQENLRRALVHLGYAVSFDTFAETFMVNGAPLEDPALVEIWGRIDEELKFKPDWEFYKRIIKRFAWNTPYHPVRDYLGSLTWDKVPLIDHWIEPYGGAVDPDPNMESAQTTYLEAVSSIVLIAAVRRIRHPGCKYDEMVVLEADQGLNKSSALRALCPKDEWFSDDFPLNLSSKELIERTLGKWIIEASDLSGKRKAELERLKALMSRQVDGPVRKAYGYMPSERPRHFILVGTTNAPVYLNDPTGGRRFWPIRVQRFDVDRLRRDRDQLWAEAAHREAQGDSSRLPERLWLDAAREQERRRELDPWEEPLRQYLLNLTPISTDEKLRIPTNDLWNAAGVELKHRDRAGAARIAEIMHSFGFKRATVRTGSAKDETEKGYVGRKDGLTAPEDEPADADDPGPPPPKPPKPPPF